MTSNADMETMMSIEPYMREAVIVVYGVKLIMLFGVVYLVIYHSPDNMKSYRIYLVTNLLTTAMFGLVLFLMMPIVTLPSLVVCSMGILNLTNGRVVQLFVICAPVVYIAHLGGIFLCLLFQYSHLKMTTIRTMFYTYKKPFSFYLAMTVVMGIPIGYPILASPNVLDPPAAAIVNDNKPDLYMAANFMANHGACVQLKMFQNDTLIILLVSMTVIASCIIIAYSYMHYHLFVNIILANRHKLVKDKTLIMQSVLYKSILAQSLCLLLLYFVPVFGIVVVVIAGADYGSTFVLAGMFPIYLYELLNMLFILYFVGAFRQYIYTKFISLFVNIKIVSNSRTTTANVIRRTPVTALTTHK